MEIVEANVRSDVNAKKLYRYFERSNGYWRLKGTNWVLFWHGPKGFQHIEDYATIARSIPASFAPPKPKKH